MAVRKLNLNISHENNYHYLPVMLNNNMADLLEITIINGNEIIDPTPYNVLLKGDSFVSTNVSTSSNKKVLVLLTNEIINYKNKLWIELYDDSISVSTFPFRLNIISRRDLND